MQDFLRTNNSVIFYTTPLLRIQVILPCLCLTNYVINAHTTHLTASIFFTILNKVDPCSFQYL